MRKAIYALAAASALTISMSARAAITIDGSLDSDYGSALTTNVNPTGFGDSNYTAGPDTPDANGSETDAAYGVVQGGNLNIFLAGNAENNGNRWNIFVADGRAGQSVLNLSSGGSMNAMNGSTFSPGFLATYALDLNDYQGAAYCEEYTLAAPATLNGGYTGSFAVPSGIGTGTGGTTATLGLNNSNTGGVTGSTGSTAASLAVTTGLEVSIPLSSLGNSTGPFLVLADINGGGDGYLSNQFLPGLPSGTGNVGGGGAFSGASGGAFNFANTAGEYFVVAAPEPASMGLILGATALLASRRRSA
ncbi:MAG TPA: hypothetical protein VGG19_20350 [Tepidisphaeraceae bacterium]|jgi:hypothetical protein